MALIPVKTTQAQISDPTQCARITVNGKPYYIHTSFLSAHPDSKIAKLYKGYLKDKTYDVSIDRDDKWFEVILNFIRDSSLKPLTYTDEELEELVKEATYYELSRIKQKFETEISKRKKNRKVQTKSYVFFDLVEALGYIKTTNRKAIVVDFCLIDVVRGMSNFYKLCYPVATFFSRLPNDELIAFYDEKGQVLLSATQDASGKIESHIIINNFFLTLKVDYINKLL